MGARAGRWQDTALLLWKPPTAWFSINAFCTGSGLRNWYVNFEHPTRRTEDGFDTFDLTLCLIIDPDLARSGRAKTSTPTCGVSASSPTSSAWP
ncbi:DUF402 domain-containing protein [Streptomyces sp. NPDC019890]|uniref:DUF402 domain-containing protein n=1 Tax=Streptomyces sp. NPDC019890 TaxID=3365064 RepID=UPI00384FEA00